MQENLGLAVMGEVPCVIVNVQRSGPSTGLATKPAQSDIMQVRWGRHGDQSVIALCPATVRECLRMFFLDPLLGRKRGRVLESFPSATAKAG